MSPTASRDRLSRRRFLAHTTLASAAGLLVGLVVFFPLFVLRGLGGGDVKLMGAMGAWLGTSMIFGVAFYTALAGGALALVLIVRHRYGGQAIRNLWLLLMHWRVFGIRPLDSLTLAYAMSVHKSQGSEYAAVVMPLLTTHFVMLSQSLLYTGVTRARKLCVLVADPRALKLAVTDARREERRTKLRERLASD